MAKRQAFISDTGYVVYAEIGLDYIELYDADFAHLGMVWLFERAEAKRAEKISSYEELMKFFITVS